MRHCVSATQTLLDRLAGLTNLTALDIGECSLNATTIFWTGTLMLV